MTAVTSKAKFAIVPDAAPSPQAEVTALFDELRLPVLRYVLSFRLPVSDAEEIVQETFLALFHHLGAGKPAENLRGWVFTVAHRLAWKHRLSAQRRWERLIPRVGMWRTPDPDPGPHERIEGIERRQRLLAVIDALPERDRCCLWLRAEGLRYREIAQTLRMSLGAVAKSLEKSFARMQAAEDRSA